MGDSLILTLSAFGGVSSLVLLLAFVLSGRKAPVDARMGALATGSGSTTAADDLFDENDERTRMGRMLMPTDAKSRREIGERLVQAGLYKRNSMAFYLTIKASLMLAPAALGFGAASLGLMTLSKGLLIGAIVGLFGTIAPSFWLDSQKKKRQTQLRRALPDALDVIIICLEGGMSLPGAFSKITTELRTAHPMLAAEMAIVQREIQMGRSTGEALKQFANRFDVEELRSLASVVLQAEKFGASVVKALRVHADSLRIKRQQYAEEMAQKAAIKILFPTLFFIFPALFIVILGPAAMDIMEMLKTMSGK
jgi:tight adherence protein C